MSFELFLDKNRRVFSITELNSAIKQLLEANIPLLWVGGEISNLVKAASGHCYFSLKDDQAQVRCVMFRHKTQLLTQPLSNGQHVEVQVSATLYEQRGDFQLTIQQVRPAGLGALFEKFEQMKQLLAGQGLFAQQHKRPIPVFPACVGIVTSPQAAALQDVLSTLRLRMPSIPVILYPVPVQGVGSAEKIATAIQTANQRAECDVLIVCRGGGSIEDLWAFNEEVVARAIAESEIVVVSGVGHETDFTIADFVADERAPTPTAAAQRVVPDRHSWQRRLRDVAQHLQRAQCHRLQNAMQTLDFMQRRIVHPAQQLQRQSVQLDQWQRRMQRSYRHQAQQREWRWRAAQQRWQIARPDIKKMQDKHLELQHRLAKTMQSALLNRALHVQHMSQQLDLLDPKRVLARGYSMVQDVRGRVVTGVDELRVGAELDVTFAQGWARVELKDKGATS